MKHSRADEDKLQQLNIATRESQKTNWEGADKREIKRTGAEG